MALYKLNAGMLPDDVGMNTLTVTLVDNSPLVLPVPTVVLDLATGSCFEITVAIKRDVNMQYGKLWIIADSVLGTVVDFSGTSIGDVGVIFSATIVGTNLILLYQTTNTGHDAAAQFMATFYKV